MRKPLRKQEETQELIPQNELNRFVERLKRLRNELERILQPFTDVPSEISSRRNELVEKVEKLSQQIQQTDPEKVDEQFLSQIQGELDQIESELNGLVGDLVPLVEEGQVSVQGYQPSASSVNQIFRPVLDELQQTEQQVSTLMGMARRGRKVTTPTFTTVTPPGGFVFPFPLSETIMPTEEEEEIALQYWVIAIEGKDQGTPEFDQAMQEWRNKLTAAKNNAIGRLNDMWEKFYEDVRTVILNNVPGMSYMAANVRGGGVEINPSLTMAVDDGWNLHVGLEFFLTHLNRNEVEDLAKLKVEYKNFIDEAIARREENPSISSEALRNLSQTFRDNPYPIVFWEEVGKIANRIKGIPTERWLMGRGEDVISAFNLAAVISMHELLHLTFGHTRDKFQAFMDTIKNDPEYMSIIREAYERNRPRLMQEFVQLWTPHFVKYEDARKWLKNLIKEKKGIDVPEDDVSRLVEEGKDIVVPPFEELPEELLRIFFNGLSNIFFDLVINTVWELWRESDRRNLPKFSDFEKFYIEARNIVKEILSDHLFFGKILQQTGGYGPVMKKMLKEILLKEAEGERKRKHEFYYPTDYGLSEQEVQNIWKVIRERRDVAGKIIEDGAGKFFDNIHMPPPKGGGGGGGVPPIFKLPPLWGDDPTKESDEKMRPEEQRKAREDTVRKIRETGKGVGKGAGDYRDMIDTIYTLETEGLTIDEIISDLATRVIKYIPETGVVIAPDVIETERYREPIEAVGGRPAIYYDEVEEEVPMGGRAVPFIFIVDTSGSVSGDQFSASLYGIQNIIEQVNRVSKQKGLIFHVYVVPADVQVDEVIDLGVFGGTVPLGKIEEVVKQFIEKRGKAAGGGGTDMLNALRDVVGLIKRSVKENTMNPFSGQIGDIDEKAPGRVTFVTVRPKAGVGARGEVEVEEHKGEKGIEKLRENWGEYVGAVVVIVTDGYYEPRIPINYLKSLESGKFKIIVRVIAYDHIDPELVRAGYAVKGEIVQKKSGRRRHHLRKEIDPELLKIAVWSRILRKLRDDYLH